MVVAATSAIHEAPTAADDATTVAARPTRPRVFVLSLRFANWILSDLTKQNLSRFHASDGFGAEE